MHDPPSRGDETPMERVERHFDDRDRMFPAADLLRLVRRYKDDPNFKLLLPWMMNAEVRLEFMADLDEDLINAETAEERRTILRDALNTARGIRGHMDAFDAFLADDPEVFEDTLEQVDAAFEKRIAELQLQSRQVPKPRVPQHQSQTLWGRLREVIRRNVERRDGPPPVNYEPLAFVKKLVEDDSK